VKRKPERPKLSKGEAKGKIVPIRFTKAEAEQLTEAAKRDDQSLSEWIRRAALAAPLRCERILSQLRSAAAQKCEKG